MKGMTHLSFGLATGISSAILLSSIMPTNEEKIAFITGSAVGALIIDIDNNQSIIGRDLAPFSTIIQKIFGHRYFVHSPLFVALFYFGFNYLVKNSIIYSQGFIEKFNIAILICAILSFISNLKDHKGLKTSILVFIITITLADLCLKNIKFAFYGTILGMCGHLLLDLFTKKGDPLLYPIRFKAKQTEEEKEQNKKPKYKVKHFSLSPMKSGAWYENFVAFTLYMLFFVLLNNYSEVALTNNTYNVFEVFKIIICNIV